MSLGNERILTNAKLHRSYRVLDKCFKSTLKMESGKS